MVQKKLPLINSAHGSETRNIINELIKLFNGMGYTYNESLQKAKDVLNEAQKTNNMNNNTNQRLDRLIADSGTSSTEVVDARGDHTVLSERLNISESKIQWVNPIEFGAVGDGVTDDTSALQAAADYAYYNNLDFIVPGRGYNFAISQPIYLDRYTTYDFAWSTVTKTSNSTGSGATSTKEGITSKSTKADAFFIGREPTNFIMTFLDLKRVNFKRKSENRVKYGLYVNSMQQSKVSDLFSYQDDENGKGATDFLCYGAMWCMMDEFRNVSQYWGITTLKLTGEGNIGSTSLNIENIVGADQDGCLDLRGAPYITITNAMIDRCDGVAFKFSSCPEVTMTSPSVEILRETGRFLELESSAVVVTSPRLIYLNGASSSRALIVADNNSRLTILGGNFPNYTNQTNHANDINLIVNNSQVFLVNTLLPGNGNDFVNFTDGGSITYINDEGVTYRDMSGRGTKANGIRTIDRPDFPKTASRIVWKKGDTIRNTYLTIQDVDRWICVEGGSPGVWEAVKKAKLSRSNRAIWSGDGTTKTFTLSHLFAVRPSHVIVQANSQHAADAEIAYATVNDTTVTVHFKNPPISGTGNVHVYWRVEE